mmetsp:Transcript_52873/g.163615  ORF Transcript_52873/g.163615 Transcript_52873/m.163615 type:complete len:201 (+) Transcript_52873:734-1336(+)
MHPAGPAVEQLPMDARRAWAEVGAPARQVLGQGPRGPDQRAGAGQPAGQPAGCQGTCDERPAEPDRGGLRLLQLPSARGHVHRAFAAAPACAGVPGVQHGAGAAGLDARPAAGWGDVGQDLCAPREATAAASTGRRVPNLLFRLVPGGGPLPAPAGEHHELPSSSPAAALHVPCLLLFLWRSVDMALPLQPLPCRGQGSS